MDKQEQAWEQWERGHMRQSPKKVTHRETFNAGYNAGRLINIDDGSAHCVKCFSPSQDVDFGYGDVAVPESCKDEDCACHRKKRQRENNYGKR